MTVLIDADGCPVVTGILTRGHVKMILTKSRSHPYGIKVMLQEGDQVGRVQNIINTGR